MFYGSIVNTDDPGKVQLFCPDLSIVTFIPSYGDHYIIVDPKCSPELFRNRFHRSVLISHLGLDLSSKEKVCDALASSSSRFSKPAREYLLALDIDEFWNAVKIYKICEKVEYESNDESIYPLFLALGGAKLTVIDTLSKFREIPLPVLFSSLLTFLVRMKNLDDVSVNPRYRRDLNDVKKRVSGVGDKVVRYLRSEREYSDFMYFVISL